MSRWPFGAALAREGHVDALAAAWRGARPFPHIVIDDVLPEAHLGDLLETVDAEPLAELSAEIYAFEASSPEPRTDGLTEIRGAFAEALASPLSSITGKPLGRVDMRAYAYREGHYLLPHTDHQDAVGRALAYAYYLPSPAPPVGGELELFACETRGGEVVSTTPAELIAPQPNRLVIFDVGVATLHQVREVLAGVRISLSGWFYARW